jgi:hypothetical protein
MREKVRAEGVYKGIKPGKNGNFILCRHDSNYINTFFAPTIIW